MDKNDKLPAVAVSPMMAVGFAVSAALSEMVTNGKIAEADAKELERRSDYFIKGLFSGQVLQVKADGLYELSERTEEQKREYPLPDDDGTLTIGDD